MRLAMSSIKLTWISSYLLHKLQLMSEIELIKMCMFGKVSWIFMKCLLLSLGDFYWTESRISKKYVWNFFFELRSFKDKNMKWNEMWFNRKSVIAWANIGQIGKKRGSAPNLQNMGRRYFCPLKKQKNRIFCGISGQTDCSLIPISVQYILSYEKSTLSRKNSIEFDISNINSRRRR